MAWQGIPFPLNGSLGLLIEKIPQLNVTTNSGFGWDTITASVAGAIIASAIPAAIAWWSIKNNNRTMREDRDKQFKDFEESRKTQITIAEEGRKAQVISANRLVWIKDLREASAEFVSTVYENIVLSQRLVYEVHAKTSGQQLTSTKNALNDSFIKLVLQSTRIRMMLNPSRKDHDKIVEIMSELKTHSEHMIKTSTEMDSVKVNENLNKFVLAMQLLLKEDWEKAKQNL